MINSKTTGLDAFNRKLDAASRRMKAAVSKRVEESADRLASAVKAAAPVSSGELRESVRTERERDGVRVIAGGTPATMPGGADIAKAQEFGNEHQPAHPFFRPTVRAYAPEIKDQVARAAEEAAKREL